MMEEIPNIKLSFGYSELESRLGFSETHFQVRCLQELNLARDLAHFSDIAHRWAKKLDITDFSIGRMECPNPEAAMIMLTWPAAMVEPYKDPHVWQGDYMLRYAAENSTPIYQSIIDDFIDSAQFSTETIRSNRYTREIVLSHGFYDYYNIPFPAINGNGNVLAAFTTKGASREQFKKIIAGKEGFLNALTQAIDYVGTKRFADCFLGPDESREMKINRKPLQILTMLAKQDLTLEGVAQQLGVSLSYVNQQVRAARDALGVNTNSGAIYKAMKAELID